jgi:hypothetical protein
MQTHDFVEMSASCISPAPSDDDTMLHVLHLPLLVKTLPGFDQRFSLQQGLWFTCGQEKQGTKWQYIVALQYWLTKPSLWDAASCRYKVAIQQSPISDRANLQQLESF